MKTAIYLFFTLFLIYPLFAQKADYQVNVTPQLVKVNAQFKLQGVDKIAMIVHPIKELPDGEATFIQNLTVKDAEGKEVKTKSLGVGDWKLTVKDKNQIVNVSYEIRLEHDKYNLLEVGGEEEVAHKGDNWLYFTGYSLFIFPETEDLSMVNDVSVSFTLPEGWKASTPWLNDGANKFKVQPDIRYLLNNCLIIGKHHEETITIDNFVFKLALEKQFIDSKDDFMKILKPFVESSIKLYGGTKFNNFLVVVMPSKIITDGGAFRTSFGQIIKGEVNNNGKAVWGRVLAHETMHLWNGQAITPQAYEGEWFKEGVTDYLTIITMARTGIIDETLTLKFLENVYTKYVIAKQIQNIDVSIQEAGKEKNKNRLLVYGGGELVGWVLDIQIREATSGTKGIDDVMKVMFEEFGKTGKKYLSSDVLRISNQISGKDFTPFFEKYVFGKEYLDITNYLNIIGLELHTFVEEGYIYRSEKITEHQKMLLKSIFGF
jgi:predicted metalloprotease with PDZ domain